MNIYFFPTGTFKPTVQVKPPCFWMESPLLLLEQTSPSWGNLLQVHIFHFLALSVTSFVRKVGQIKNIQICCFPGYSLFLPYMPNTSSRLSGFFFTLTSFSTNSSPSNTSLAWEVSESLGRTRFYWGQKHCRIFKLKGKFFVRCRSKDTSPVQAPLVLSRRTISFTLIYSVQASTLKAVQSVKEGKKGKFSLLKGACVYMLSSSGVQSLSSEKSRAFKSLSLGCHLDLNL